MEHESANSRATHYSCILCRSKSFRTNFHNSYELIAVLAGGVQVTVNESKVTLTEKEFLLISPCMSHRIQGDLGSEFYIAIVAPDHIPDFFASHKNTAYLFYPDEDAFSYVCRHLREEGRGKYRIKACLYMLLSFITEDCALPLSESISPSFIYVVNAYIAEHFRERITRRDLAAATGYEPHYFSTLFRKNFSINLCKYINMHRVSHACALLRETEQTITRVAFACGFSSVKEFNNVFKTITGKTPTAYRGKHCKE